MDDRDDVETPQTPAETPPEGPEAAEPQTSLEPVEGDGEEASGEVLASEGPPPEYDDENCKDEPREDKEPPALHAGTSDVSSPQAVATETERGQADAATVAPVVKTRITSVSPDPTDVIRVFIGTEPKTELARKVLEFSILSRSSSPVEFTPLIGEQWEETDRAVMARGKLGDQGSLSFQRGENKRHRLVMGTGFSLRRWLIPKVVGWKGKAIYLDADQLVLGDIAELWNLAKPDGKVAAWCTYQRDVYSATPWPQTSVMVLDCAVAQGCWGFHPEKVADYFARNPRKIDYANYMHGTWLPGNGPVAVPDFWNHLDRYTKGVTRLIHYTKEDRQPWYNPGHPLAAVWKEALVEALTAGHVTPTDVREALARWKVREDRRKTNGLHPSYASVL